MSAREFVILTAQHGIKMIWFELLLVMLFGVYGVLWLVLEQRGKGWRGESSVTPRPRLETILWWLRFIQWMMRKPRFRFPGHVLVCLYLVGRVESSMGSGVSCLRKRMCL